MVSMLDSGLKGPGSSPAGSLCCVLGQESLYSINGYQQTVRGTCDGLASHPGGVTIFLVASCYENRDKLQLCGPHLARVQTLSLL